MPNAKSLEKQSLISALIIGKSGCRKSSVGASFPKPLYHFDFDNRIAALRGMDIDYDTYPRMGGWKRAGDKFTELIDAGKNSRQKYRTVHIASITTILDFFLWEALEHYSKDTTGGFRINRPNNSGTLLMSDMPHYKYVHRALDDLIYNYIHPLSLFYNVLVEAHEQTRFDKEGDPIGDEVLATPAISQRLPTTFNETWQFKFKKARSPQEKDSYVIWFRNNDLAKTTFRSLPDSLDFTGKESVFYDELLLPKIQGESK